MPRITQDFDFTGLSLDERTALAHQLWASVQREMETMPFTDEQRAEIERRMAEADAGRIPTYPWDEVKQRLLSRR